MASRPTRDITQSETSVACRHPVFCAMTSKWADIQNYIPKPEPVARIEFLARTIQEVRSVANRDKLNSNREG